MQNMPMVEKIRNITNRGMIDNKNALNDLNRKPADPAADELDGRDGAYDALVKVRGRKSARFHIITADGEIIGCGYAYLLGWKYTPENTLTIFTTTHQFTMIGTGMEEIERALLREVVYELREYNGKADQLRPGYDGPIIQKLTIRSAFDKPPKTDDRKAE